MEVPVYGLEFLVWTLAATVAYALGGIGMLSYTSSKVWEDERWLAIFTFWPLFLVAVGLQSFVDWIAEIFTFVTRSASNDDPEPPTETRRTATERQEIEMLTDDLKRIEQEKARLLLKVEKLNERKRKAITRLHDLGVCGYRDDHS